VIRGNLLGYFNLGIYKRRGKLTVYCLEGVLIRDSAIKVPIYKIENGK